ncbi:NAD(P)-binding domain-containing protein [Candidatus Carsonella ruddii]|nr:NAD(P)-binding domain-containing protein [Candidatus Carsonella ruddii]
MINHLGLIGYGPMSKNISINLIRKKIKISIFNKEKIFFKKKINIILTNCLIFFLKSFFKIKILLILIKTGKPVKIILIRLKNKLKNNDIVIDFGNSFYKNTFLNKKIIKKNINFISSGISGGYEGALNGLCIMIDCKIKIFYKIFFLLKILSNFYKKKYSFCLTKGIGSSHYLKMIHNGIEYGILQLISEIYFLIKIFFNKNRILNILLYWNKQTINSYLLELLYNILIKKKKYICDVIDQKGTGKWMCLSSIKNYININCIFEALIIRIITKNKFYRNLIKINNFFFFIGNNFFFLEKIKKIFLFCNILCYIQGFNQLIIFSKKYDWKFDFKNILKTFLKNCIIRSNLIFFLINFKKNFFFVNKFFFLFKKYYFYLKEIIIFSLNKNINLFLINSSYNFLLIIITKNYNFKIIQFQRNKFGDHNLKYI